MDATALRAFPYSDDGVTVRTIAAGEAFACRADLFLGLERAGYVRRAIEDKMDRWPIATGAPVLRDDAAAPEWVRRYEAAENAQTVEGLPATAIVGGQEVASAVIVNAAIERHGITAATWNAKDLLTRREMFDAEVKDMRAAAAGGAPTRLDVPTELPADRDALAVIAESMGLRVHHRAGPERIRAQIEEARAAAKG
ncbi:hypothetical protein [Salinarimonas sp. NSM]|uniref:hypothetical protein n=1 Tax=Salinarimonas sp. NSM TaxID=3458003 RepID=UPI004036B11A